MTHTHTHMTCDTTLHVLVYVQILQSLLATRQRMHRWTQVPSSAASTHRQVTRLLACINAPALILSMYVCLPANACSEPRISFSPFLPPDSSLLLLTLPFPLAPFLFFRHKCAGRKAPHVSAPCQASKSQTQRPPPLPLVHLPTHPSASTPRKRPQASCERSAASAESPRQPLRQGICSCCSLNPVAVCTLGACARAPRCHGALC